MSFVCLACGRQRAGASGYVCDECKDTQMGAAAGALVCYFENREVNVEPLADILDAAANRPPEGDSDGSITEKRWNRLTRLVSAGREFNAALEAAFPHGHQEDW